jgi:hypothetical protein
LCFLYYRILLFRINIQGNYYISEMTTSSSNLQNRIPLNVKFNSTESSIENNNNNSSKTKRECSDWENDTFFSNKTMSSHCLDQNNDNDAETRIKNRMQVTHLL